MWFWNVLLCPNHSTMSLKFIWTVEVNVCLFVVVCICCRPHFYYVYHCMISNSEPSQELARQQHSPSLFCNAWTSSCEKHRPWSCRPLESWLYRFRRWATQRRGFDPPLGTFSGRGDFSLGVNVGSNSIPPKTLSDESINRGLVCAHMHFIARTQKILTFMS